MKYKLICFDLDGTIIDDTEYIWYTFHQYFGVDFALVKKWHKKFTDGLITYDEWFAEDIKWWNEKKARKSKFIDALKNLKLMNGAMITITELKKRRYKIAIISGSLNIVLDHFFPKNTFDYVFINEIYFDNKEKINGFKVTPYDFEHKAQAIIEIAKKEKLQIQECVFVGDNTNDIEALKLAGLGIAFNSKSKEVENAANVVIKNKDIREILKFL